MSKLEAIIMPRLKRLDKEKAMLRLKALEELLMKNYPEAVIDIHECLNTIFFDVTLKNMFFVFEYMAKGFGYGDATHALLVSDEVNVWHYVCPASGVKPFAYWLTNVKDEKDPYGQASGAGWTFNTLEEMIEAAYSHIDPLKKPLPPKVVEFTREGGVCKPEPPKLETFDKAAW
jgi:hypothetical protein